MPEHLGGYIEGGDEATFFPELWTWLVNGPLKVKSVVDIGCGEGHSSKFFADLGCRVTAIDGIDTGLSNGDDIMFHEHDFTKGSFGHFHPYGQWDLAWTCEFVEHIEEQYARNIVSILRRSRVVLMTHAFPGQAGTHHVNCQPPEYWRGFMAATDLRYSKGLTDKTREIAAANKNPWNHYLRSGMAFRGTP